MPEASNALMSPVEEKDLTATVENIHEVSALAESRKKKKKFRKVKSFFKKISCIRGVKD